MTNGIEQLHSCLLNIAKDFHKLCDEYNLQYFIIGGTFLGAVRHKGFIPWDDDMDIGMPRDSYEKFLSLPDSVLPPYMIRMDTGYNKTHGDFPHTKLCNRDTTLVENIYEYRITGAFIDIFPIDGAHNTKLLSKLKFYLSRIYVYGLLYNGAEHDDKLGNKFWVNLAKKLDNRKIYAATNRMLAKTNYSNSKYIGNFMGIWGYKEIMPKSFIGTPQLYDFEDTQLYGPERADDFLTAVYGDYMKLPPIEKQKSHHTFEHLDLDMPFEEYYRSMF